jgi:hypothetical protein
VSAVDQFVWNVELDGIVDDACEVGLVVQSSNDDEPVWSYLVNTIAGCLGCLLPIVLGTVSPGRLSHMAPSDLIP